MSNTLVLDNRGRDMPPSKRSMFGEPDNKISLWERNSFDELITIIWVFFRKLGSSGLF